VKYVVALLVSVGILFLYAIAAASIGWRKGGGAVPQFMLWTAIFCTWRSIIRKWPQQNSGKPDSGAIPTSSKRGPPFAGFQDIQEPSRRQKQERKRLTDGKQ